MTVSTPTTPRKIARAISQAHIVADGSFILLLAGTPMANPESLKRLAQAFARTGRPNVVLAVVSNFNDLSVLSEQSMNQLGWYRSAPLEGAVSPPPVAVQD